MAKVEALIKEINGTVDPIAFFSKLTDSGKKDNCILLESADVMKKLGEKSLGGYSPSLRIVGRKNSFEIIALNEIGKKILILLKDDFDFCETTFTEKKISGKIKSNNKIISEEERLDVVTLADVLRKIGFKFKDKSELPISMGLFGGISYDFIDQFEKLPENKTSLIDDPDFDMIFLDNLFLIDHQENKTIFVANYFPEIEEEKERCETILSDYKKAFDEATPPKHNNNGEIKISTDTDKEEYMKMVEKGKEHIVAGDVFQIVLSRTKIIETNKSPLNVYASLKKLNPSPYMFYFKTENGVLLGSSPETFIKVSNTREGKKLEIRPIAGTRARGLKSNGEVDLDLDSRYENELKSDKKEVAEHTMLVDLARNDVAHVCKAGTRVLDRPHYVEKYSHVMHLVSNVSGILKDEYDALHAYLASMNMGTLSGAPKVKAMELIRKIEKNKRGFYGGSIGYLTPKGEFDSAIVIRSMRVLNKKYYVRAGAGIVYDSVPEKEYEETEKKAMACIKAIEQAECEDDE